MRRILIAILIVSSLGEASAQTAGRRRAVRQTGPVIATPVAAADSYSLSQGSTLTIAAPGVLANDTLHGAVIASFGASTGTETTALGSTLQTALGGSLSLSADGGLTYTPSSVFSGTDTFKYVIRNAGGSSSATVTIVVRAIEMNAVGDSYTTPPESALNIPAPGVLTNDTLAGGRIVSFGPKTGTEQTSLTKPSSTGQGGMISLMEDGSFTYSTPQTTDDGYGNSRAFLGFDGFYYRIQRESLFLSAFVRVSVEVPSAGADYVVTTPGHFYAISSLSGENPMLQLSRGRSYKFRIGASASHPFAILDAPAGSVTNNNITDGIVTFTVPLTPQSYRYRCTTHGFGNVINTVP